MSSVLHAEIGEQPEVIRRLLQREGAHIRDVGKDLSGAAIRYVVIAARGTSDNAARYGQYLFGALNRLTVALATPSLYSVYERPPRLEGALVIGISQSGQSPDIVRVLEEGRRQGVPTVAVTNDAQSPLAASARHVLELHAGAERSVAATKTYTAQLAALALLSLSMANGPEGLRALATVPEAMQQAVDADATARLAAQFLARSDRCAVVGRGFNYATAFEIALKIKELAYVAAEPYSSADFMHGPIAMVDAGFPVVLITVGATLRPEMLALAKALRDHEATLVLLGDDTQARSLAHAWLPVPERLPEWLTPMVAVVPGQLLAYHLALARGHDPDRPRTIGKVTLTR